MSLSKNSNMDALIMSAAHVLIEDTADYMRSIDTSNTVISKKLDKRIYKRIRQNRRENHWNQVPVTFKKIVAAVMVFCTISFALCMSVEAVRENVWNTILEWYDKFVAVFYVTEETPPSVIEKYKEPSLQLTGSEKTEIMKNDVDYFLLYSVDGMRIMTYQQKLITDHSADIDGENCDVTNINIHNYIAQLFTYTDGVRTLSWHGDIYAYIITVTSSDVLLSDIINIAESVK